MSQRGDLKKHLLRMIGMKVAVPPNYVQTPSGLFAPYDSIPSPAASFNKQFLAGPSIEVEEPKPPVYPVYEVNMMEPLVGWKCWKFSGLLNTRNCIWPVLEPLQALCTDYSECPPEFIPHEDCSCGIYAGSYETAREYFDLYTTVMGMVYGWGRYVRGDNGWRAQYAYPKCFYLKEEQMHWVDALMKYRVPIYVKQPISIYDPEEDGYYEYGQDSADGSCRAFEVSDSAEDSNKDDKEGASPGEEIA